MRNIGTLRLRLVALGVAAALGSSALLAQQRDPSPIERDRPAVPDTDSLDRNSQLDSDRGSLDSDRQAQSSPSQRPGQSAPGAAGQSPGAAGQSPGIGSDNQRQAGQLPSLDDDSDLQASDDSDSSAGGDAFQAITDQHDDLGTFVELIQAAGLEDSLTGGTEYTVFAPTDEAFEKELETMGKTKEELMSPEGREDLVALLRAHIVADDVDQEMARNLSEARTIDGGSVSLSMEGDELTVGDAKVVASDIQEGSLRVYAIDGVLEPNAPAQAADASELSDVQGEQPAASVQTPRGEQPSASARELDEEDEPEPRLN